MKIQSLLTIAALAFSIESTANQYPLPVRATKGGLSALVSKLGTAQAQSPSLIRIANDVTEQERSWAKAKLVIMMAFRDEAQYQGKVSEMAQEELNNITPLLQVLDKAGFAPIQITKQELLETLNKAGSKCSMSFDLIREERTIRVKLANTEVGFLSLESESTKEETGLINNMSARVRVFSDFPLLFASVRGMENETSSDILVDGYGTVDFQRLVIATRIEDPNIFENIASVVTQSKPSTRYLDTKDITGSCP